jgi:hypothetical protein
VKKQLQGWMNKFDIDPHENWLQAFGKNVFLWPFPIRYGMEGDGLVFKINQKSQQKELSPV